MSGSERDAQRPFVSLGLKVTRRSVLVSSGWIWHLFSVGLIKGQRGPLHRQHVQLTETFNQKAGTKKKNVKEKIMKSPSQPKHLAGRSLPLARVGSRWAGGSRVGLKTQSLQTLNLDTGFKKQPLAFCSFLQVKKEPQSELDSGTVACKGHGRQHNFQEES